ncbi:oxidation resistance protein 1 [Mycoblastus sanguinarius]|nr:oxidation resistance protein 1 [Mycoblastus sanguinarius]
MSSTPKSASTTGTSTPSDPPSQSSSSSSSYLSYPVSHVVSGLYRRLTEPSPNNRPNPLRIQSHTSQKEPASDMPHGVYTPPHRTASPFQPPPLTPLTLSGSTSSTILSKAVAEEIRLLVPPRLQLADTWSLAYSLEGDGVSLATLYNKCSSPRLPKGSSFVLVVQDGAGGVRSPLAFLPTQDLMKNIHSNCILLFTQIFGAYLTSPPHPHPSFYGTGECFLWRASILPSSSLLLSNLPPPPSAPDTTTTTMGRSTTIASPTSPSHIHPHSQSHLSPTSHDHVPNSNSNNNANGNAATSGTSTPDLIRFKAFPYSGVNDYLIFCEQGFLSVGGGDGRYGLWLDGVLERGVSSHCMTFGNESLSEEGEKFEVVGVEVWCVGG